MIEQLIPDSLEFKDLSKAEAFADKVRGEIITNNVQKVVGTYDCWMIEKETIYVVKIMHNIN